MFRFNSRFKYLLIVSFLFIVCGLLAYIGVIYRQSIAEQNVLNNLASALPGAKIDIWYQSHKYKSGEYPIVPPVTNKANWFRLPVERVSKIAISYPPDFKLFGGRASTVAFASSDSVELPKLCGLKYLEEIDLAIYELKDLKCISSVSSLKKVTLHECNKLINVNELANLTNLVHLEINGCSSLMNLDGILELEQLKEIVIFRCESLPADWKQFDGLGGGEDK